MARNRKNESAAVRLGPVLKVVVLCACIGGAGLGYVWQQNQIKRLGDQMKRNETEIERLRRENKARADQLAFLRSPRELDRLVKERRLGLVPPRPDQILRFSAVGPAADRVSFDGQTEPLLQKGVGPLAKAGR